MCGCAAGFECIARRFVGLGYELIWANGELVGRVFSVIFVIDGQTIGGILTPPNAGKLAEIVLARSGGLYARAVTENFAVSSCE